MQQNHMNLRGIACYQKTNHFEGDKEDKNQTDTSCSRAYEPTSQTQKSEEKR